MTQAKIMQNTKTRFNHEPTLMKLSSEKGNEMV